MVNDILEANKFLEIRELCGLSQGEFAAALKITRETVNKIESGKFGVSKRTAERLKQFLATRQLPNISQDVNILGMPSQISKKSTEPYYLQRQKQKNEDAHYLVPLVGIKAQAGYIKGYEQVDYMDTLEQYSLPPGVNPVGAIWRYFEIDGDSMEPSFSSGDVVLATMVPVEDWQDLKDFGVYVILTEDQLMIKRIFKKSEKEWVLVSDNEEDYPQVLLPIEKVKQVWLFRRHIRSKVPQPRVFKIAI